MVPWILRTRLMSCRDSSEELEASWSVVAAALLSVMRKKGDWDSSAQNMALVMPRWRQFSSMAESAHHMSTLRLLLMESEGAGEEEERGGPRSEAEARLGCQAWTPGQVHVMVVQAEDICFDDDEDDNVRDDEGGGKGEGEGEGGAEDWYGEGKVYDPSWSHRSNSVERKCKSASAGTS